MAPYSLYSLRRRWQGPLPFRNAMYPILATLLVVHAFWIFYDITITSNEHHRPKRKSVQVTESSPLSPFYPPSPGMEYDGFTRAFPVWSSSHFPCGLLEDKYTMRTRTPATEGFFYVKEVEASAVIFSSVTARIARNMGRRQQQQQITNNDVHKNNNATANVCTTRLVSQRPRRFHDRTQQKSFLWSVVREPVGRLLSKYYHYGQVATRISKRGTPLSRFQNYVFNSENQDYGYYFRSLGVDRKFNPYKKEHEADSRELLESYDFLGVSERMDESLAVLKIILNLDIQDVLYLHIAKATSSSKNTNGALIDSSNVDYYENWGKGECRAIPKPEVTLAMKEWFHSEEFEAFIEADVIFYKAVNASLDRTIAELGRDLVEKTVKQIRWAQKLVEEKCQNVRFPCSSEGELQKETDCLFSNIGCGYNCLDELGNTLSQDPGFPTL